MIVFTIPMFTDVPWFRQQVTLSGNLYNLRFRFNVRSNRWIMDIADANNTDVLLGLPVLILRNLNNQFVVTGNPPGVLYADDNSQNDAQPSRLSFGIDHTMYYGDTTQ